MENSEVLNLFKNFLKKKRLYLTNSRLTTLQAALRQPAPFDAESLWASLKPKRVGLTTVYRTLDLLVEAGLAKKIRGRTSRFEVIYQKPATEYLQCANCGRWIPFPSGEVAGEISAIAQQLGFTITNMQFSIQGECRRCKLAKAHSYDPTDPNLWK